MITTHILIYLVSLHFLADFVLQSDWMAKGKSKEFYPLICHVLTYSGIFLLGTIFLNPIAGLLFTLINGLAHIVVDYITSRINSKLWASGNHHNFFVGLGFDQFIHYTTIILTAQLF